MKKILGLVGIILSIGICAILANAGSLISGSPIIGEGGWCRDGSGNISPCVSTDTVDLEGFNLRFDTPSAYMHEDNNGGSGSTFVLSTTFSIWSGANASMASVGLTVDESGSTIALGTGLGGKYVGTLHGSFKAPSGKTVTIGIFTESAKIDDIKRSMSKGPELLPSYINITSDTGSAVFGTQSAIRYLYANDGDDLIAIEAGTGSTRCMDIRIGFTGVIEPECIRVAGAYKSNNSNHWGNFLFKNWSTGLHVDVNELSKDFEDVGATLEPYERVTWLFAPIGPASQYVQDGVFEVLYRHNDVSCSGTHEAHLDEVKLIEAMSSAVVAFPVEFEVSDGEVLRIKIKADEEDVTMIIHDLGLNIFKIGL